MVTPDKKSKAQPTHYDASSGDVKFRKLGQFEITHLGQKSKDNNHVQ